MNQWRGQDRVGAAQDVLGQCAQQHGVDGPDALAQHRVVAQDQHPRSLQKLGDGEFARGLRLTVPEGGHLLELAKFGAERGQDALGMQVIIENTMRQCLGAWMLVGDGPDALR